MTRLIFLTGHAGTGKTTLARRLVHDLHVATGDSYCLLDKDTLYGSYSSAVMGVLTGNPNDRDSPAYLQHLREPEYVGLLETARDNLCVGTSVIVVAPLSREVRQHQLHNRDWLRINADVSVRVVWLYLNEDEAHRRITQRGNPNDQWKLAHWDAYRTRLFMPRAADYPELYLYDNTAAHAQQYQQLVQYVLQ